MSRRVRVRNRLVAGAAWALTGCWIVVTALLVWPYSDVTFPQGNVATVEPSVVAELGTITVTFPAYCNRGQTVTVTRFADIYRDGHLAATEQLNTLTFYPTPGLSECRAPEVQEIALTTAFQAYGEAPTVYRIRSVTAYKPNPIRTVRVEALTEPFTVTPR